MASKADLRRKLKQARLVLSLEERQAKSTVINGRLWESIDWSAIKTLHCFEPIERLGEVDITDFIETLRTELPSLELYTAHSIDDNWLNVSLDDKQKATPVHFDVVIVPMLGFDSLTLNRIGYGGGYYDKFLATQAQAQMIGVCFEQGKLDDLPIEPHDIPLDLIVTEDNLYRP